MRHMYTFVLSDNKFTALPDAIGSLMELRLFSVDGNGLTDVPGNFGELHKLRQLNMSRNK